MKLKIAAITLALSTASILGACASPPEAEITPEEGSPENSLSIPDPTEELSEYPEVKLDDPTSSEQPSVTDELPGATIDGDGNLELTAPVGDPEGDLTTEETVTPDTDSVEDTGDVTTEETQPLSEEDTQTSN